MSDYDDKGMNDMNQVSCAYFGEGVMFKGSVHAPEKVIVHGIVEGEVTARDLLIGPTGVIKGNVKVDSADVQGQVFDNIEAKICLSLRRTGRIEGSATYGDIEIEKGGVLSGQVSTLVKTIEKVEKVEKPEKPERSRESRQERHSDMPTPARVYNNGGGNRPTILDANKLHVPDLQRSAG